MKKTYRVIATKTGKEWKSFNKGMSYLEDDKTYTLQFTWTPNGIWEAIRWSWIIKRKYHGTIYRIKKSKKL